MSDGPKTPDQHFAEDLLRDLDPAALEALLLVAAAHWIPPESVFRDLRPSELLDGLSSLVKRGLVRALDTGALQATPAAREAAISQWLARDPELWQRFSARLREVFARLDGSRGLDHIEAQYHALVVDPLAASQLMFRDALAWSSYPLYRFDLLARLIEVWREQANRGALPTTALDYLAFVELLVPVGRRPPTVERGLLMGLLAKEIDDPLFVAEVEHRLGLVLIALDDLTGARMHLESAFVAFMDMGDLRGSAGTLRALGRLEIRANDFAEAQAKYRQAAAFSRDAGHAEGVAHALRGEGDAAYFRGQLREAFDSYGEAIAAFGTMQARVGQANARMAMGQLLVTFGRLDEAWQQAERAKEIYEMIDQQLGRANAEKLLATVLIEQDDFERARAMLAEAQARYEAWSNASGLAAVHLVRARLERRVSDEVGCASSLEAASDIYERRGDFFGLATARREWGLYQYAFGDARVGYEAMVYSFAAFEALGAEMEAAISFVLAARSQGGFDETHETMLQDAGVVLPAGSPAVVDADAYRDGAA